jgi:uncharacterized protein YbjT (DUF2867 family)
MKTVLLIGSTGFVGNKVLQAVLAKQKYTVKVLVRKPGNLDETIQKQVTVVVGDLMDRASLEQACQNVDVVINTANGYMSGHPEIDTVGANNLVDACKKCQVPRLIYCSILTADQAKSVEHFYDKYLVEQYMIEQNVPFVALRPGCFIDQTDDYLGNSLKSGSSFCVSMWNKTVPIGMILTKDLAQYFADAIELPETANNTTIDVGLSRPVTMVEVATICGNHPQVGRTLYCVAVPSLLRMLVRYTIGYWKPFVAEMINMFTYFDSGLYINQVDRQTQWFGPPPTPEAALHGWIDTLLLPAATDPKAAATTTTASS